MRGARRRRPEARQYRPRLNYRSDNRIARVMPLYIVPATFIIGAIDPTCLLRTFCIETDNSWRIMFYGGDKALSFEVILRTRYQLTV